MIGWLGLPAEAGAAFLMGFLRRDFGATGLFVMQTHGCSPRCRWSSPWSRSPCSSPASPA